MAKRTKGATPAVAALEAAGVAFTLHAYDFEPTPGRIGLAAAEALGVAPDRLLKTLMAVVDDKALVTAILASDQDLDPKALAKAAGGKRAALAPLATAERATGYVKGGISPLGQRARHKAFLDAAALGHPTVLVNAGRRGLQAELAPADLVGLLGAVVVRLGR